MRLREDKWQRGTFTSRCSQHQWLQTCQLLTVAGLVLFKLSWGLLASWKLQGSGRNPREVNLAAKVMSPDEGVTLRVRPGHQHRPNARKPSPAHSKT